MSQSLSSSESTALPKLPPTEPVSTTTPKRRFNPQRLLLVGGLLVLGYLGWRYFTAPKTETVLPISGRVEADETDIGAKTGGRIAAILVQEGDVVKAGQVVVRMEDPEVDAQLQAVTAQVNAARQEMAQAKLEVAVADSRIQESTANLEQAKGDTQGRLAQATATVSAAKAQLAQAQAQVGQVRAQIRQAEADLKLAQADRERYRQLVAAGAINRQRFEQAQTKADTAQANLDAARAGLAVSLATVKSATDQVATAQGGLTQTQSTQLNPVIRTSQRTALQQQKQQAYVKLAGAQAKVQTAIANQQQLQKRLDSFQITSPITGIVQDRPVEPGAVVATGKTLLTLINPKTIYLRAYIPEGDLGKIYVGKPAQVFLDSRPSQPLSAKIIAIDPKASFTPENIYFKKDRVRQVFGIKLGIIQEHEYAKPGMPADAEIELP
jgi:HlyD family secretion protein